MNTIARYRRLLGIAILGLFAWSLTLSETLADSNLVAPAFIEKTLDGVGAVSEPLTVDNTRDAPLDFEIAGANLAGTPPTVMGTDNFGYHWTDSDQPNGPDYVWNDISETGTRLSLGNDSFAPFDFGFSFPFYGNDFTQVFISSNGYLTFGEGATNYQNTTLPSIDSPANLIAGLFGRFVPSIAGSIYTQADFDRVTIQYQRAAYIFPTQDGYSGVAGATFQIILRRSGVINIYYKRLDEPILGVGSRNSLDHFTVGIQNDTRDDGLHVVHDEPYVRNGLALEISNIPVWLSASQLSGNVPSGGQDIVNVTMDSSGLVPGIYTHDLAFFHNDPTEVSTVVVPVTLTVTSVKEIDAPTELPFGYAELNYTKTRVVNLTNAENTDTTISDITSNNVFFANLSALPITIPAFGSIDIELAFTPAALGEQTGTITMTSDAVTPTVTIEVSGIGADDVVIAPDSIADTLDLNEVSTHDITIANVVDTALDWEIDVTLDGISAPTLTDVLNNLNNHYGDITEAIPSRFDFEGGVEEDYFYFHPIVSTLPYDEGNRLSTNQGSIPYSNNTVTSSTAVGGDYFTRKYNGLFVFAGDLAGVTEFKITGTTIAQSGIVEGAVLTHTQNGVSYKGFLKKTYQCDAFFFGPFPSINHLIIVEDKPGIGHNFSTDVTNDSHNLTGISSPIRVYELLYSSKGEGYIDNETTLEIMQKFLRAVDVGRSWLRVGPTVGTTAARGTDNPSVMFDAYGMAPGTHTATITVEHNSDGLASPITIPVTMNVNPINKLAVSTSSITFDPTNLGETSTKTVTLRNEGNTDSTISAIGITNAVFTHSPSTPLTVPAFSTVDLEVTFTPTVLGTETATVTLTNDAGSPIDIALSATGYDGPSIVATPNPVVATLDYNTTQTHTVTIDNPGDLPLEWSFPEEFEASQEADLNHVLQQLNANYTSINSIIPDRYDFRDGVTGTDIPDGGGDMYDGGNQLGTDLGGPITYSDNVVTTSAALGGEYFTKKYPGLFVFAGNADNATYFEITGHIGEYGGTVDSSVLTQNHHGKIYKGFVKRVYGVGSPSVNHLILVEDESGVDHTVNPSFHYDDHRVTGISGSTRVYCLVYASRNGGYIDDNATADIMNAFLNIISPRAATVERLNGTTAPGNSDAVTLHLDSTGLVAGPHAISLPIRHNAVNETSPFNITVSMTVNPKKLLEPTSETLEFGRVVINESRTSTLGLMNPGNTATTVSAIEFDNDVFSHSTTLPLTIPAFGTVDLDCVFSPTVTGDHTATMTITSDAETSSVPVSLVATAINGPHIILSPNTISITLEPGVTQDEIVAVNNTGQLDLEWTTSVDLEYVVAADSSLEGSLMSFNQFHSDVSVIIPNRYDFRDGDRGHEINDDYLYDPREDGNHIFTAWDQWIGYTNNKIWSSAQLGGGQYFTSKVTGLFMFAGDINGPNAIAMYGRNYRYRNLSSLELTQEHNGVTYKGFVKRLSGPGYASMNRIIVVKDMPGLRQEVKYNEHILRGMDEPTRVYFLLYAARDGGFIDNDTTAAIMTQFIRSFSGQVWMTAAPGSQTTIPGSTDNLTLSFDTTGLKADTYTADVIINHNATNTGNPTTLPVTLTVSNAPPEIDDSPVADPAYIAMHETTTVSVAAYDRNGDELRYEWSVDSGPGNATFALANDSSTEVSFDAPGTYTLAVDVSDGTATETWYVTVEVVLLPEIDITGDADFGSTHVAGGTVTRTFEISNIGSSPLSLLGDYLVDINGTAASDFIVISDPDVTLAVGDTTTFEIEFDPSALGTRSATVSIANDDPDENPYTMDISGSGINLQPIAVATAAEDPDLGDTVTLSALESSDPDNWPNPLRYTWNFVSGPIPSPGPTLSTHFAAEATFTPEVYGIYTYELYITDGNRSATARVAVNVRAPLPRLNTDTVAASTADWTTVSLPYHYTSMVVVCTPVNDGETVPVAVRVKDAAGNSFKVRLTHMSNSTEEVTRTAHFMVVEEGQYTVADHGLKMEAVKYASTKVSRSGNWTNAEGRGYQNSYSRPVVVGQIMTGNDLRYQAFWAHGLFRAWAPGWLFLKVGRHVGEDPATDRLDETVGYVVLESGSASANGINLIAGVGADSVQGIDDGTSTYAISGLASPDTAVLSAAGMDGSDGGFPILTGQNPVNASAIEIAFEEDTLSDAERSHNGETVAYIVFDTP